MILAFSSSVYVISGYSGSDLFWQSALALLSSGSAPKISTGMEGEAPMENCCTVAMGEWSTFKRGRDVKEDESDVRSSIIHQHR